jgi:hypothetical protein
MRKFGVFAGTILVAIIIAGLYGVLHDQVTYSISAEYFTKFKYRQFRIDPAVYGGHRQAVAMIGFLATWWMGYIIGIPLALTGLIFRDNITMRSAIIKAIGIVFFTVILFGIAGYFYGKYHLIKTGVNWWMPDDLVNKNDFIIVGSIHNFSYLGGITGLVFGIIYMIVKRYAHQKNHEAT